ncbi:MAG: acyl-CoA dehydrogenase family protein [Deltaproteobacteria bacterium]|nr:acyl-CoA dehydrogenase family protein [Deltaproteobacteria bacterium]
MPTTLPSLWPLKSWQRWTPSAAMIVFVTQTLIQILKQWSKEEQKRRFFGKMANAPTVNAFSLTEANCGSESASVQTRAVLNGDHYLVNGTKLFVTNGSIADLMLVVVHTGEGEREKGTPGFTVVNREDKLGLRGIDLTELVLNNVKVPVENLIGRPGEGWNVLMTKGADMRVYGPGPCL